MFPSFGPRWQRFSQSGVDIRTCVHRRGSQQPLCGDVPKSVVLVTHPQYGQRPKLRRLQWRRGAVGENSSQLIRMLG